MRGGQCSGNKVATATTGVASWNPWGNLSAALNPGGKTYIGDPAPARAASGDARILGLRIPGGSPCYVQVFTATQGGYNDIQAGIQMRDASGARCSVQREVYHSLPGNSGFEVFATGQGGFYPQLSDTGNFNYGLHLDAARFLNCYASSTTPTAATRYDYGYLTGFGLADFDILAFANNGQNGWSGSAAFGDIVVTRGRNIQLREPGCPNGSVRVLANGIAQDFGGAVFYRNLDATGAHTLVLPNGAGWFPMALEYQFYTGAALGGTLRTVLTVPVSWGGDNIGAV